MSCALFELLNDVHMSESPTNVIIYEMQTNSVLTNLIYASWIIFNCKFYEPKHLTFKNVKRNLYVHYTRALM